MPRTHDADKDEQSDLEQESIPDVQLTSFVDWKQVATWYAKLQGERVVVDDTIRAKALELTHDATAPAEKAKRLYDYVAKEFRYVSLSFGVGRYQPHSAPEVLRAGYGDCKDKHTLLAALLRAIDVPSYPVLIGFGRDMDVDVPSPAQFNHVISMVRVNNDWVWLDATTEVAPFGLILYPLRDKQALVAAENETGGVRKTPARSPVKSTLSMDITGKVSETGTMEATFAITTTGDNAFPLRSALRSVTVAEWQQLTERIFSRGEGSGVSDIHVDGLEDTSRPLQLRFHIHQEKAFSVPSSNASFGPFPPLMLFPALQTKRSSKPLRIGPAMEASYHARIEFPPNFSVKPPAEISMHRDYADYSTSYRVSGNVLEVSRTLSIKADELPPARLSEVLSLRGLVLNVAEQSVGYVSLPASQQARLATAEPAGTDTPALFKAGTKALQQEEYQAAVDLLKRVVAQDPNHKSAWSELGRAYVGLDDHDDAIGAFKKQVEVDPFHKSAFDQLAEELQQVGKVDEAIATYRKQLENDSLDQTAHKNLGLLLFDAKRDQDALAELQAAAAIPPTNAEIDLALGQLYSSLGDAEKAKPLLVRVVGDSAPFPNGDIYAAALGHNIDPEQSLRDAQDILSDIGDQFESGTYTELTPETSSAMQFVALEWARIGWAKHLKGQGLEALRYLSAAWLLSQSGTVANRLALVYEKGGQLIDAKRMLALAVVAGGAEVEQSRAELQKLAPTEGAHDLEQAKGELATLELVKISANSKTTGFAEFSLVFDGSSKPDRVVYRTGNSDLRKTEPALLNTSYPVQFPDQSSIKIIRRGKLSCTSSGCTLLLGRATWSNP